MSTETTELLEQRLEEVRANEQAAQEKADRDRADRELQYRRQRLAEHDPVAMGRRAREAQMRLFDAVSADPLVQAFTEAVAAKWEQHRAAVTAAGDREFIARAEGRDPGHAPDLGSPAFTDIDELHRVMLNVIGERIAADQAARDEAFTVAVFGDGLTSDQIAAAEQQAEEARRREAAKPALVGAIDVTGMSDSEREAAQLPSGGLPDRNSPRRRNSQ